MKENISAAFAAYEPVHYKTFQGALDAFFEQECPQIGGSRTRQALVNAIYNMVLKFFPETNHLRQGQIVWATVHKDARGAYGKSIKDTELTPVVLTLVQSEDAMDRARGKKLREIKKEATVRLCQEAYAQNGCLTETELAVMLKMSQPTVGHYLREYEAEHKTVLPRRGTIHDMGPTLTHKKIIIEKLFIEQKTVQQVIRETCHSARAIERYITSFKQILLCYRKGMSIDEISFSVRKTKNLVQEYLDIIEFYKVESEVFLQIFNGFEFLAIRVYCKACLSYTSTLGLLMIKAFVAKKSATINWILQSNGAVKYFFVNNPVLQESSFSPDFTL